MQTPNHSGIRHVSVVKCALGGNCPGWKIQLQTIYDVDTIHTRYAKADSMQELEYHSNALQFFAKTGVKVIFINIPIFGPSKGT